jgi:hypothetical protein
VRRTISFAISAPIRDNVRVRALVRIALGLFLLAFGGLSVHYTSAEDADHHRVWAQSHGMPAPQPAITVGGWVAIAAGVLCIATARRARKRA